MPFIVFNTVRKAERYVDYRNSQAEKHNSYEDTIRYFISGSRVLRTNSYEWFCGSSEPENGYICCSDYHTDIAVIGRIKKLSK
jgi:hypothetical protein